MEPSDTDLELVAVLCSPTLTAEEARAEAGLLPPEPPPAAGEDCGRNPPVRRPAPFPPLWVG